jgi:hypothetical protein
VSIGPKSTPYRGSALPSCDSLISE